MTTEKTCFIIMPISTPETLHSKYRDKGDHFKHVLDCLIMASVEKAGFKAIPPVAEGADLIHAEIIKYLETADLVLCDTSALNANVFFEFGIRCALNKPVCIIKDDVTEKVPFDTSILNHHKYRSTLEPWDLPAEIDSLVKHIAASVRNCKDTNPLWKYFGAKAEAEPPKGGGGAEDKIDLLFMQMDAIRQQLGNDSSRSTKPPDEYFEFAMEEGIKKWLLDLVPDLGPIEIRNMGKNMIRMYIRKPIGIAKRISLEGLAHKEWGIELEIMDVSENLNEEISPNIRLNLKALKRRAEADMGQ